jgi:hypothetical protein
VTCQTCGGPIHRSTVGSGFNHPVWVHSRDQDWVDNPHNAIPPKEEENTNG